VILGVAALSYWLGTKSWTIFPERPAADTAPGTISLPEPRPAQPEPEIVSERVVKPEPLPAPPVVHAPPAARSTAPARREQRQSATKPAPKETKKESATKTSGPPEPWPVRKVEGAAGRLVHVGTFATRRQAKRGWNALMRVNPALQRLPAMVVPVQSRRDGRVYYRLQMGTTSQAHSVVLCQRMRMIGQSCIVLADAVEKKAQ
jgi:type IV secretory pathway VirB10-like protein